MQRLRILQTAKLSLQSDGLVDLSAAELARRSGVSRATFYRAYPSVEAVVDQLYAEYLKHVTQRLLRFLQSGQGRQEWLGQLVQAVLDDAVASRQLLVAMFREELRPGSKLRQTRTHRVEAQVQLISQWWQESSQLPADPSLIRAFVLLLQIAGLHIALEDPAEPSVRVELQRACEFIISASTASYEQSTDPSDGKRE